MVKIWKAAEVAVKVDLASNVTIDTSGPLSGDFSGATTITGYIKDFSLTEPIGDIEKIDLQGTDANGFQNAEVEEKPASLAEISGTLVLPGDEGAEKFFYDAGTAITGGYTRYRPGKASVRTLAFLVDLDDGTDQVTFAMDNTIITAKDTSVSGADSHFEASFTGKCLPRDFYGPEFKD